jgi:hypothetical protein
MSCNVQHCEVLTRPSHAHTLHYGVAVSADLHAALLQVGAPLLHMRHSGICNART